MKLTKTSEGDSKGKIQWRYRNLYDFNYDFNNILYSRQHETYSNIKEYSITYFLSKFGSLQFNLKFYGLPVQLFMDSQTTPIDYTTSSIVYGLQFTLDEVDEIFVELELDEEDIEIPEFDKKFKPNSLMMRLFNFVIDDFCENCENCIDEPDLDINSVCKNRRTGRLKNREPVYELPPIVL